MLHPDLWRLWWLRLLVLAAYDLLLRCIRLRLSLRFLLLLRLLFIFVEVHFDHVESLFPSFLGKPSLRKNFLYRCLGIIHFGRLLLLLFPSLGWLPRHRLLQRISFYVLDIAQKLIIQGVLLILIKTLINLLKICLLFRSHFDHWRLALRWTVGGTAAATDNGGPQGRLGSLRHSGGGGVGTSHGVERLDCAECFDVGLRLLAIEHNLIIQVAQSFLRFILVVFVLVTLRLSFGNSWSSTLGAGTVVPTGGAAFLRFRILARYLSRCRRFLLQSLP